MPENDRLSGCLDEINLDFVERECLVLPPSNDGLILSAEYSLG